LCNRLTLARTLASRSSARRSHVPSRLSVSYCSPPPSALSAAFATASTAAPTAPAPSGSNPTTSTGGASDLAGSPPTLLPNTTPTAGTVRVFGVPAAAPAGAGRSATPPTEPAAPGTQSLPEAPTLDQSSLTGRSDLPPPAGSSAATAAAGGGGSSAGAGPSAPPSPGITPASLSLPPSPAQALHEALGAAGDESLPEAGVEVAHLRVRKQDVGSARKEVGGGKRGGRGGEGG